MKYLVAAVAGLTILLPSADAGGCARVTRVVEVTSVVPVVPVATLVVPQVQYPVLGLGYSQGYQGTDLSALVAELRALRSDLTAEIHALRVAPTTQSPPLAPAPMPKVEAPTPKGVPTGFDRAKLVAGFQVQCAKCHNPSKAEKGLVLVPATGALPRFTRAQKLEVVYQLTTGQMPKGGPPPTQELLDQAAYWVEVQD